MLRKRERFVIQAVAEHFGARWREGEDPPDAHLQFSDREIALEVSTLVQRVPDGKGGDTPRQSQDAAALRLADDLNDELSSSFHGKRAVSLILSSPLHQVKKLRRALTSELQKLIAAPEIPSSPLEIVALGNDVLINVHDEQEPGWKRIAAFVVNRNSSADILANAKASLADRLAAKAQSCKKLSVRSPIWLALLNVYDPLADADTYRQAAMALSVPAIFERITLISTQGAVEVIFERSDPA